MKVYDPRPNLYFLPKTILFMEKIGSTIELRDRIVKFFGDHANVQIPK